MIADTAGDSVVGTMLVSLASKAITGFSPRRRFASIPRHAWPNKEGGGSFT